MREASNEFRHWHLYKQGFDLLCKNTDEYAKLQREITDKVVCALPEKESLLDIGAGRGNLTLPLCRYFERITIVEPNKVYFQEVISKGQELGVDIDGYNQSWEEVDLAAEFYDLILCVHVLYYVKKMQWKAFINKMNAHLKETGRMVIVLISQKSNINDLYRRFLPSSRRREEGYSSEELVSLLQLCHYNFEVMPIEATIWSRSLEEFMSILSFLLHEDAEPANPGTFKERISYANTRFRTGNGYQISNREDIVIVRRRTSIVKYQRLEDAIPSHDLNWATINYCGR